MDHLQLPGVRILDTLPAITARGRAYHVHAEQTAPAPACCGTVTRNGRRTVRLTDTPAHGGPVTLNVDVQRWRCAGCRRALEAPLAPRDPDFRMTRRAAWHAFAAACDHTFADVAREFGVSTGHVRDAFWRTAHQADALLRPEAPRVLGIDEVHLPQRVCAVLVNAETGAIVDLLPGYSRAAVAAGVRGLQGYEDVQAIAMDFAGAYAGAVADVYGDARPPIVLDRRHVLELARRRMEAVRKELRDRIPKGRRRDVTTLINAREDQLTAGRRRQLREMLDAHPRLRAAHQAKEDFYRIFEQPDRAAAEAAFDRWAATAPADFTPVADVVRQRRADVFAAFDWPGVTNARTENLNGRLKALYQRVRGYGRGGFASFRLLALHRLGERRPDVVAEAMAMAARAILDGRAPWRERSAAEVREIVDGLSPRLVAWTRRLS